MMFIICKGSVCIVYTLRRRPTVSDYQHDSDFKCNQLLLNEENTLWTDYGPSFYILRLLGF